MRQQHRIVALSLLGWLLLIAIAFSAKPALADIPALCSPAQKRFDQAITVGDRSGAIAARERIRVLSEACPNLWKSVRKRKLPPERPETLGKAAPTLQKNQPKLGQQITRRSEEDPLLLKLEEAQKADDYRQVEQLMSIACGPGSGGRCLNLAKKLAIQGAHTPPQARMLGVWYWERAREMLTQECQAGNARSCKVGSEDFFRDVGLKPDMPRSRALLEKGCSLRDVESCGSLGHYLERGWGGPPDYVRARAIMSEVCSAGRDMSCLNLAEMFEKGVGGPIDLSEARSFYAKACKLGNNWACQQRKRLN